jgi:hypothetical protein
MTDDLFAGMPPMKSPRLLWMEKHGITTERKATSQGPVYTASSGGITENADNEHDALVALAIRMNLKLWNQ